MKHLILTLAMKVKCAAIDSNKKPYALPICGALLVAVSPLVFDTDSYLSVVTAFQNNISLAIGVIAFSVAVSIPFQTKIFAEDNEIVLHILQGTEVRRVFMDALQCQAA